MTDQIPVKAVKSGGAAVALGEYEVADRVPSAYLSLPKGYIDGMRMEWVSGNSYRLTSGSCYIPSLDQIVDFPSSITKSGVSLTASTWYHIYAFVNAGVPDVEAVTTAPASPYNGTARTKTGDTSRRYIGSVKSDPSNALWQFSQDARYVKWFVVPGVGAASIFRVLSNGTATTATTFSLSSVVPVTSTGAYARLFNTNATGSTQYDIPGRGGTFGLVSINAGVNVFLDVNTDASQQMNYMNAVGATSPGAYADVLGYVLER